LKNLSFIITKWLILPSDRNLGGILVGINENKLELLDSWILTHSITLLIKKIKIQASYECLLYYMDLPSLIKETHFGRN
jgi:hypothetical protein